MFNVGDWVWGIDRFKKEKVIIRFFIVGDIDKYYIGIESFYSDDSENYTAEAMIQFYAEYVENGEMDVVMVEKENTFATEQEAREVLEVMQ